MDSIETVISGTSANYFERSVGASVDTIEEAAAFAQANVTNSAIEHLFFYNSTSDVGFLLMDTDNNDVFEIGVILAGKGSATDFSYADLI